MDLLQRFKNTIQQQNLFSKKDRLLLAVSGGIDSVVLCELCKQAGFDFIIVHCNFRLRGEESERDERFVKQLGEKYKVGVEIRKFDTETYAKENRLSVQVAARELRYSWFYELMDNKQLSAGRKTPLPPGDDRLLPIAHWLLTAHHLDDNIETMLMNFFKGTGITGLRGMLPVQGKIIRPLLFAKRKEMLAFAEENKLEWVEDSSNISDKYSRNFIRHRVVPLIQNIYPEAENNLAANLQRFSDAEDLYRQAIEIHKKKLIEKKGNEIHIPVLKLKKSSPLRSIVYEIVKDYGFHAAQADEIISLLDSESGKYMASASHRILKNRNWLIIAPLAAEEAETVLIEEGVQNVRLAAGSLQFEQFAAKDYQPGSPGRQAANSIALLDAKEIQFPLLLRRWKQGDYFYPLGMRKKKKLARFFIDQKLSMLEKEKIRVLEMNRKIIWIIGYRIDDRFKVTDKTEKVLKIISSL